MMPANLAPLMSSASDEWATPQWLYALLNEAYNFTLDPCATAENAKCERFYTQADNGLVQPWIGRVFVNPPYSDIKAWAGKAITETAWEKGAAVVVLLVPSRTDTKWFQSLAKVASVIIFLKGRLKFGDAKSSAPFPSALVVLTRGHLGPVSVEFGDLRK